MKKAAVPRRRIVDVVVRRKIVSLFLALDKNYVSSVIKGLDGLTYSHAHKTAQAFEQHKLFKRVDGNGKRSHYLELTPKGKVAADALQKIVSLLNGD